MPEGHTLHRLAGELTEAFGGRVVASSSPQGRFDAGAARLDGRVLLEATARGKHVLVAFEGLADQVHVHLGLFGGWQLGPGDTAVRGQVRWRLQTEDRVADLRGPTACALLGPPEVDALLARLGPDPLVPGTDPEPAWLRIAGSRTSIAALLMDQSVVAGVGNVYRAEVLFRHGVDPTTPGRELSRTTWDALWDDLVVLMREGVRTGRIDTVRPEHEPGAMGRPARRDDHGGEVYVYRRDGRPCLVCGSSVQKATVAARNLFWCPTCQRGR
ncbi:DNA glycosylase [Aeromicrobium sp. Root495]|uniref:Fpg/Nei family DNA glycosylase n=1 Tax=Aeromicrobium sp. Root495 TaxID=1736550 RepID=UPI0006FC3B43|nr:DNA-formamidopyrimidine glycosylase family protein [Aeromicrobium sp. Root495]KQY58707.1 DNA glycosylase [Aeromicrobium sp. Root495]